MNLFNNFSVNGGLFLILSACVMLVFPPKFGNFFYGVRTKWTMINEVLWAAGQRLFAYSIMVIGIIVCIMGIFHIDEMIKPFPMVLILIGLSSFTRYFVHKNLENRVSKK